MATSSVGGVSSSVSSLSSSVQPAGGGSLTETITRFFFEQPEIQQYLPTYHVDQCIVFCLNKLQVKKNLKKTRLLEKRLIVLVVVEKKIDLIS